MLMGSGAKKLTVKEFQAHQFSTTDASLAGPLFWTFLKLLGPLIRAHLAEPYKDHCIT